MQRSAEEKLRRKIDLIYLSNVNKLMDFFLSVCTFLKSQSDESTKKNDKWRSANCKMKHFQFIFTFVDVNWWIANVNNNVNAINGAHGHWTNKNKERRFFLFEMANLNGKQWMFEVHRVRLHQPVTYSDRHQLNAEIFIFISFWSTSFQVSIF